MNHTRTLLGLAAAGLLVTGPLALSASAHDGADDPRGDDHGHHHGHHHGQSGDDRGRDDRGRDDRGRDDHGRDDRSSGRPGVSASGACTGTSTWTLKAKPDDGAIEAEFEVDTNVAGQTWAWRLTDDGVRVAKGRSTTAGASGSFTVQRTIPDRAGADTIAFRATFGSEVCRGSVTL